MGVLCEQETRWQGNKARALGAETASCTTIVQMRQGEMKWGSSAL